jgi:hypothetical protein
MGARLQQPAHGAAATTADEAGPGPGEYYIEEGTAAARGPAFSMAGRIQANGLAAAADNPGPGRLGERLLLLCLHAWLQRLVC